MKTLIIRIICLVVVLSAAVRAEDQPVKVMVLTDQQYGGSYAVSMNKIESIETILKSYGWDVHLVSVTDSVNPCPWAGDKFNLQPMEVAKMTPEITAEAYDAFIIIPGRSHENLIQNKSVLKLLQEAVHLKRVVAAWCRGVKVLAAADIIEGKTVIGHIQYAEDYEKAGADYIKYVIEDPRNRVFKNITPPVSDQNIITTVRSLYYREPMCQLIKNAVDRNRHPLTGMLQLSDRPVWSVETGMYTTGIDFADMDQNGYVDIVVSSGLDARPEPAILYNNDRGRFADSTGWQSEYVLPGGNIFVSDLDANDYPDLVISHLGLSKQGFQPGSHVLFYNHNGFLSEPDWRSLPANGFSCTGGDFDGDGDMDLAFGQGCNALNPADKKFQRTVIYRNTDGKISQKPWWQSDDTYLINDIAAVDLDSDGDMDLVISGKGYGISVFYNREGRLETSPSWQTNSIIGARQMAFGDYNDDGYEDLAVAAPGKKFGSGGSFYLFRNNQGTLDKEPVWECDAYQEPSAVRWADMDGDGDMDLLGCGFFSHFGIFENSNHSLSPQYKWAYQSKGEKTWYQQLAVADFDEDYLEEKMVSIPADGKRKLFSLRKNMHELVFVKVADTVLSKDQYCFDLQEGWLSLKEAPAAGENLKIYFRYSLDLDVAVSAIRKIRLFENRNVK